MRKLLFVFFFIMLLALLQSQSSIKESGFPRIGNLWGYWELAEKGYSLKDIARYNLLLGWDGLTAEEMRVLKKLNPNIKILCSINAIENEAPDHLYLRDINGEKIEVWTGSYRVNMTLREAAEFQARMAIDLLNSNEGLWDGIFIDNVMLTQSWQTEDMHGKPVQIDSDLDGQPDSAEEFDKRWQEGVMYELELIRKAKPNAILVNHAADLSVPGISRIFNGHSIGFSTANIIEGEEGFFDVLDRYISWLSVAKKPAITMIEGSPLDDFAYGYGYQPHKDMPESAWEAARTDYRSMRFGLGFTLLGDGYYAYEIGDTYHGNDWWYDEYDFKLGQPRGPYQVVDMDWLLTKDALALDWKTSESGWDFWTLLQNPAPAKHSTRKDRGLVIHRVEVLKPSVESWHVSLSSPAFSLVKGRTYTVRFRARSPQQRALTVGIQQDHPEWENFGLWRSVSLDKDWKEFQLRFDATLDGDNDAKLRFYCGEIASLIELSDISIMESPPCFLQREFDRGLLLLNPLPIAIELPFPIGYTRFKGDQAPRYIIQIEDDDIRFKPATHTAKKALDSGEWKSIGPYFHDHGSSVHFASTGAEAGAFTFEVPEDDMWSLSTWIMNLFSYSAGKAKYSLYDGKRLIAEIIIDQSLNSEAMVPLFTAKLLAGKPYRLSITRLSGTIALDCLELRSARRYNDGNRDSTLRLGSFDAILLRSLSNP